MADEAGSPGWPWAKTWLGPPAGPSDSWTIYNNANYQNYLPRIKERWFSQVESNIRRADARWISWYGKLEAGPFNTDCFSPVCVDNPQPIPPRDLNTVQV